jgi:hypothetical protein
VLIALDRSLVGERVPEVAAEHPGAGAAMWW